MSSDDDFERPFEDLEPPQWAALRELCQANVSFFASDQDECSVRIKSALVACLDYLGQLFPIYRDIAKIAPLFDFNPETPGNGYRSFLVIVDKCILYTGNVCRRILCQRDSMLFSKNFYMKEIEVCAQLLASLFTCLQHLRTLYSWSQGNGKEPSLFSNHSPQELLNQAEAVNQYCFYGRAIGFQFCDSMQLTLRTISLCMAAFSEAFFSNGTVLGRCANSIKYVSDPEAKARRIVNVSQRADISFCKAFWLLNESGIAQIYPSMVMPTLAINQMISIPPEEIKLATLDNNSVVVPTPTSHIGKKPIHVRLMSAKRRMGMVLSGDSAGANLSLGTTLRCFELNIRRPDGIFMAYAPVWVEFVASPARLLCLTDPLLPFGFMMRCLKAYAAGNPKKLSAENLEDDENLKSETESFAEISESDLIALALSPNGDDDGPKIASLPSDSTLNSVSLADVDGAQGPEVPEEKEAKSQEYITRFLNLYKNSSLRSSFPVLNGNKDKDNEESKSKSWSLFGWNSTKTNGETFNEEEINPLEEFVFSVPRDPLLSPYLASDNLLRKFPPVKILTVELDPCLDDCVMFAKKLKNLGNSITLDIIPGLPHGFLNFCLVSKEAGEGSELCVKRIRELMEMSLLNS
ncbi:hormone-sensitive lipase [Belonocnema kinseyi]|uniref:hormone-sensitive lipase n=1 Tax=Belonocnema kinseyi TaxID=2817044 RepID=UPI00143CE16D|nr:hormone-sensitive lipase [Belonocnema kinseyi]